MGCGDEHPIDTIEQLIRNRRVHSGFPARREEFFLRCLER